MEHRLVSTAFGNLHCHGTRRDAAELETIMDQANRSQHMREIIKTSRLREATMTFMDSARMDGWFNPHNTTIAINRTAPFPVLRLAHENFHLFHWRLGLSRLRPDITLRDIFLEKRLCELTANIFSMEVAFDLAPTMPGILAHVERNTPAALMSLQAKGKATAFKCLLGSQLDRDYEQSLLTNLQNMPMDRLSKLLTASPRKLSKYETIMWESGYPHIPQVLGLSGWKDPALSGVSAHTLRTLRGLVRKTGTSCALPPLRLTQTPNPRNRAQTPDQPWPVLQP